MTFKTTLSKVTDVKKFAECASQCRGDVTVSKDRFSVSGKSLMGLFSIDTTSEVKVKVEDDDYFNLAEFDRNRK